MSRVKRWLPPITRAVGCRLWSINRALKWLGLTIVIGVPYDDDEPTMVFLKFSGWPVEGRRKDLKW